MSEKKCICRDSNPDLHLGRVEFCPQTTNAYRNKEQKKYIKAQREKEKSQGKKEGLINELGKKSKGKMHLPGLEPGSPPWKGGILPLDHKCLQE